MAKYDFDIFVIGAGSGGVRAARLAAQAFWFTGRISDRLFINPQAMAGAWRM